MPYVRTVPYHEATGELKETYDQILEARGSVPNVLAVSSIRPQIVKTLVSHVGSVMLSHNARGDVGIFCLLSDCKQVVVAENILIGLQGTDEYKPVPYDWDNSCYLDVPAEIKNDGSWHIWPSCWGKVTRVLGVNNSQPNDGAGRNVHAMSGRAV